MMGRPPTEMRHLAEVVLEDGYSILSKNKFLCSKLGKKYKAVARLKQRYLSIANHGFLCPQDLSKMINLGDQELVCQKCGYAYAIPVIPIPNVLNNDVSLFPLGSYSPRSGELKGFERFLRSCEREIRSILERYSLSDKVLDHAGRLLKQNCEIYYDGRSTSTARYQVTLLTLTKLSKYGGELKFAAYSYLINPVTPLKLDRNSQTTKSTKLLPTGGEGNV
jgi:hypothetical protein